MEKVCWQSIAKPKSRERQTQGCCLTEDFWTSFLRPLARQVDSAKRRKIGQAFGFIPSVSNLSAVVAYFFCESPQSLALFVCIERAAHNSMIAHPQKYWRIIPKKGQLPPREARAKPPVKGAQRKETGRARRDTYQAMINTLGTQTFRQTPLYGRLHAAGRPAHDLSRMQNRRAARRRP